MQPLDNAACRFHAPPVELLRVQYARPTVEQLNDLGAAFNLSDQIIRRRIDQQVNEHLKFFGPAFSPFQDPAMIGAAAPLDHINGNRPG